MQANANMLDSVLDIAQHAGERLKRIYLQGDFSQGWKADKTPVTSADYAAHRYIVAMLERLTPNIPVLSEEHHHLSLSQRAHWSRYWLIDPLDGTQEFVNGTNDFACVIALVEQGQPTLGVVYAPMHERAYMAQRGAGAFCLSQGQREAIHTQHYANAPETLRVVTSRVQQPALLQAFLSPHYHYRLQALGSASLKACWVAQGQADCYIRIGPTGEWDTAAVQIILQEAGGDIRDLRLQPLSYNCRESFENPNFIAFGDPHLAWSEIISRRA